MSQTRMTKQRAVIVETLRNVCSHPTADEVYGMVRKRLPHISLGTVYRNLDLLTQSGEIKRLERAGLQMRFDGDTRPHHHVRCRVCGSVGDVFAPVEQPPLGGLSIPGFEIDGVEVEFVGVCHDCQADMAPQA